MNRISTASSLAAQALALNGGSPARTRPWPERHLFGQAEKAAAMRLFDEAIDTGKAFGYGGPEEEAYCQAFAAWLGGGYADAVNSGTTAVYVALRALELPAFSEVIVPPISDAGGVMPVPLAGLIPVPADCAPGSLNAGPQQIEARITPRTSAILVAHIAGHPCDMKPIVALAKKHNLKLIEDCAQAHGATYDNQMVGTFGDIAAFSTMSGKHHATAAQGGVVFTRDEQTAWRAKRAADRGKPLGMEDKSQHHVMASLNFNSNELACAVGSVQLQRLPGMLQARRGFANQVIEQARSLEATRIVEPLPQSQSAFWFLVVAVQPDKLAVTSQDYAKALIAEGIQSGMHYHHCPIDYAWYRNRRVLGSGEFPWAQAPAASQRRWTTADLPNAQATSQTLFPIMAHEKCTAREADDIITAMKKIENAYLK